MEQTFKCVNPVQLSKNNCRTIISAYEKLSLLHTILLIVHANM